MNDQWSVTMVAETMYGLRERLPMLVVYDHPTDFPQWFVGRLHVSLPQPEPTPVIILRADLDAMRHDLAAIGLTPLARSEGDDPKIIETWL